MGTVATTSLWFAGFDPYRTLFGLGWINEFDWALNWTAYVVTAIVIVGSLFIHRFWCRYLCPLGAILSLVQRFSLFKIQRDPKLCINCGKLCESVPSETAGRQKHSYWSQLHRMPGMRGVVPESGRTGGRVHPASPGRRKGAIIVKVHKYLIPVIVIVLLLGTVQVAKVLGYWSTTGKGEIAVDDAGQPDPAGIKGWMTLAEVSGTYGIPQERLYTDIGLPKGQDSATPLKELEGVVPDLRGGTGSGSGACLLHGDRCHHHRGRQRGSRLARSITRSRFVFPHRAASWTVSPIAPTIGSPSVCAQVCNTRVRRGLSPMETILSRIAATMCARTYRDHTDTSD